jgi:WS/DGAT/MGAT family acyltransferase
MHGGNLLFYAGTITREELMQSILERLPLIPRLRQRVVFPPFAVAMPSWEDDPEFDIASHVLELTLPAPGDDHVLAAVVGKLHAQPLGRNRPLWQMTVLNGRPDGNTVVYFKSQHALVDGPAMMELLPVLHDPEPGVQPPVAVVPPPPPTNLDPITQLQDAVRDRLTGLVQLEADLAFRTLRPDAAVEQARRMMGALTSLVPEMLKPVPTMPWNGPLTNERRFAWLEVPLATVQAIKTAFGGTVNDVALTVLAGGLGRYLRQHGHATAGVELRDMVTVSLRRPEERGTLGNRVGAVSAPLYVGIEDPVERLRAERAAMDRVKEQGLAGELDGMTPLSDLIPPIVWFTATLPRRQMPRLPIQIPQPVMFNVISSNIPGPRQQLYLHGHELLSWQAAGICMMNIGIFLVVLSYHEKISFSVTVDPSLVPDEWVMVDHIRASLAEMEQAAAAASLQRSGGRPEAGHTAAPRRQRRRQRAASRPGGGA